MFLIIIINNNNYIENLIQKYGDFDILHNMNNFNNNNNNNYNNYRNINLIRNENSNNNIKMIVKRENDLNEWIQKNIKNYQKKKEKNENLSINARFEMMLRLKEKDTINEILELSNERIAINIGIELKIYSLKTFKLLTKIDEYPIDKYIELENKDLVGKTFSFIYFYKLLDTEQYHLFQTIEEKSTVNCIVKLMNGNLLLSCNDKSINIYGKEGNSYKLLSQNNNEKDCGDAIEIEDNKVVIFKKSNNNSDREYQIFLYDILTQNKKIIMNDFYTSGKYDRKYLNMIKNDEYLFINFEVLFLGYDCYNCVRTSPTFISPPYYTDIGYIFNLGKENYLKCEYDKFPDKSGIPLEIKPNKFKDKSPIILSNYNKNTMIVTYEEEEVELLKFKDKQFIYEEFPFEIKNYCKCVKLKNNNFIFYFDNQMILIKYNK